MVHQRGDGGCDLGRIGRQRGHDAEQRFGEPEALTDPLESRNEDPARGQADPSPDDEGREGEFHVHGWSGPSSRAALSSCMTVGRDG